MTERPILFSGAMVRAILDNRKAQTRREVKPRVPKGFSPAYHGPSDGIGGSGNIICLFSDWGKDEKSTDRKYPYAVGDVLWVRETCAPRRDVNARKDPEKAKQYCLYRADDESALEIDTHWHDYPACWTPSIHMPRWACRLRLEIAGVKVERLQDISEEDAKAEGVQTHAQHYGIPEEKDAMYGSTPWYRYDGQPCSATSARHSFETLWDSINGSREGCDWKSNPWVWALIFKKVES